MEPNADKLRAFHEGISKILHRQKLGNYFYDPNIRLGTCNWLSAQKSEGSRWLKIIFYPNNHPYFENNFNRCITCGLTIPVNHQ